MRSSFDEGHNRGVGSFDAAHTGRVRFGGSLLIVAVGLATCFAVNDANGQATTTTTTNTTTQFVCPPNAPPSCTTAGAPGPTSVSATSLGANTGGIAASLSNAQVDIEELRRRKQKKYLEGSRSRTPLAFAPDSYFDPLLGSLAYAAYKKAPQPPESGIESAVFAYVNYEHEKVSGTFNGSDIGSNSRSWGGFGGLDFTYTLPSETYFTIGLLAGATTTFQSVPTGASARTDQPTVGAYVMYFAGNFSADLYFAASSMRNSGTDITTATSMVTSSPGPASCNGCTAVVTTTIEDVDSAVPTATGERYVEGNVHYKINLDNNWWWEPTTGFAYTYLVESQGFQDQKTFRVQGGAKFGTSFVQDAVVVEPSFTGLVMSDVSVTGGSPIGGPAIVTDQGQVWGKGVAKLNVTWPTNFSSYIKGAIYGTRGTESHVAYGGEFGVRYAW
jgi:hypothetical protein